MKNIRFILFATALATLSGCSDDTIDQKTPAVPAKTGDEITFGSSLNEAKSRVIYDDEPQQGDDGNWYYRVRWEDDGSDHVAIYCPEAAQTKLVDYSVSPDPKDPTYSSTVTKLNPDEAGLQWGADDEHHFYGFYPAKEVTGEEDGKIRGNVSTTQNVVSWNIDENDKGGKTYYGKTNTDYAYMWAYGKYKKSEMGNRDVPLDFHPWMTVLEITIQGSKTATKKISNINIVATEGTQTMIAGDFIVDMTPVVENTGNAPNYEPVKTSEVNNMISISGNNPATNDFIELGPNDEMVVRAYLLPIDENSTNARNIKISVQTMNGAALTRTLGYSNHGEHSIQPHKVNRVTLPPLEDTGTNYWMSQLDRDIFLSELSIPGSKFAYLTSDNTNGKAAFQGTSIRQQFLDGVRAFIIQVGANVTYNRRNNSVSNATMPIFCGGGDNLESAISLISSELKTAENELGARNLETAVVMLTYAGNEQVSTNTYNREQEQAWMDALEFKLNQLKQNSTYRIFADEITPNTTLGDAAGKIIIKVNTNSDLQNNYLDEDAGLPALFSRWNQTKNTVPLRWGTSNTGVDANLRWMYQEATHVGDATEITATNKLQYINDIFDDSVTEYQKNDAHNIWFMNDCGGTFQNNVSGATAYNGGNFDDFYGDGDANTKNVTKLTQWLNPWVRSKLQERTQNASTGLVFFNYADKQEGSGAQYGTDQLIQTIIDNNFKFNLRKKGSTTNTASYDAAYSKGGNVWD